MKTVITKEPLALNITFREGSLGHLEEDISAIIYFDSTEINQFMIKYWYKKSFTILLKLHN